MPRTVVLGLGSNVGSREALLRAAADLLSATPGLGIVARARVVRTHAIGPAQPDYLNAALRAGTDLSADEILAAARDTERRLARERRERWGPRTIDVDLLWIDGETVTRPALVVPHAGLLERGFALGPLLDVVPDARDPSSGVAYGARLASLDTAWIETPRALGDAFAIDDASDAGFTLRTRDRADLFAAAAEAMAQRVTDRSSVSPREVLEIGVVASDDAHDAARSDEARLRAWLAEVDQCTITRRFAVRRAVVFADDAQGVRGALLGESRDAPATPAARVHSVAVTRDEHGVSAQVRFAG